MLWLKRFGRRRRVGPDWYRENGRILTRFQWDGVIAARVKGRTNSYSVFGSPRSLDCTCDARLLPCPHVVAVQREWEERPEQFPDLRATLESRPADERQAITQAIDASLLSRPGRILDAVEKKDFSALAEATA